MSGCPDPSGLDRQALQRAFDGLSRQLGEREIRAHIYVVGGAAIVLAHRYACVTQDADALATDRRDEVFEVAGEVAREQGLSPDWLNDAVRGAPWPSPRPDTRAAVVYDSQHLVVAGASAAQVLAMKVRVGPVADRADIEFLIRHLRIATMLHVEAIHHAVFPHDPIPKRNVGVILDCLQRVHDA